jgi:hypothetical protein
MRIMGTDLKSMGSDSRIAGTDLNFDEKKYEKYESMRRSFIKNDTFLVKA